MHPNPHTQPDAPLDPLRVPDPRISAFGATNGAKYKMMSPAKLPISRSPCLTVPPGLSPGALLESPVLLTNIKAEPSPTTGTFLHSFVNGPVGSNSTCSPRGTYRNSAHNGGNLSDFEFKPHIRMSSRPGFSSLGHLAANPTQQEREFCRQVQKQPQIQILDSSQIVQAESTTRCSRELTLSVTTSDPPIETSPSEAVPDEVAPDELQHTMGSDNGMQALQCDNNGSSPSTAVEKSSEDGYNWRKYGQKHVKGSEFPRSYYKCTHPNCQMKKQLERSHDGHITEIIYKGQHDHPKPESSRRLAVGTILSGQGEERSDRHSLASAEEKLSNAHQMDPNGNTELSPISPSDDDPETGVGSNCNGDEVADDDDLESKRRKLDSATFEASQIGKTNREPRVVVQTISEVDILDDGYRWRKYGQKVVKGNPNPRSYYKCTNVGCSVRKHVERASHDPKAVITTYEGKHNHDVPAARNSSHDTAAAMMSNGGGPLNSHMPTALSGMLITNYDSVSTSHHYSRPEETDMISLDLGVGINANQNSCTATEKLQQTPGLGRPHSHEMQQFPGSDGNKAAVQETPLSIFYGSSGNGLYGSNDANAEGFSFRTPPVNHSSEHYYPNSGNLVMGP